MSMSNTKLIKCLSWTVFLLLAIQTAEVLSGFTDVPPPPPRPERFNTREELRRYLQLVHEYYAIIGRPRFGRSSPLPARLELINIPFMDSSDVDNDRSISYEDYHERLEE